MTDWGLVAKIAGGGFGSTLLVLVILSTVVWLIGFAMRRRVRKANDESK